MRTCTVYDWAYTTLTGEQKYARTPEMAASLQKMGFELTPVYTIEDVADELYIGSDEHIADIVGLSGDDGLIAINERRTEILQRFVDQFKSF